MTGSLPPTFPKVAGLSILARATEAVPPVLLGFAPRRLIAGGSPDPLATEAANDQHRDRGHDRDPSDRDRLLAGRARDPSQPHSRDAFPQQGAGRRPLPGSAARDR